MGFLFYHADFAEKAVQDVQIGEFALALLGDISLYIEKVQQV
jgi:hypothetical protein